MDNGAALRIAIARYRLRAAAHRIAADCERMLDDMDRPERRLWRDAVGEALVASRHLVALVARRRRPPESRMRGSTSRRCSIRSGSRSSGSSVP